MTIYADKFYTYEDHVLTALQSLRQRQVEKEGAFDDSLTQVKSIYINYNYFNYMYINGLIIYDDSAAVE